MPQNPGAVTIGKDAANAQTTGTFDGEGGFLTSGANPKYAARSLGGTSGMGANQTGVTASAALATTYVGICLSNPAASGKNLVLRRVTAMYSVLPAAANFLGLITGYAAGGVTVHTTPLVVQNAMLDSAATLVAKLDAAATLVGTPRWARWLAQSLYISANNFGNPFCDVDLEGSIIVPPGGYAAVGSLVAGPSSGFLGSFAWDEIDV